MDLTTIRTQIDAIDTDLVRLIEARMQVVIQVAEYKAAHNIPILNQAREAEVLTKINAQIKNPDFIAYIDDIYQYIMDTTKRYQIQHINNMPTDNQLSSK